MSWEMISFESFMQKGIDYIGVNCAFVCHDGQGRILLHKRSENCRDEHGRWDCGAGALEHGESFEDAVKREVFEEYGTKPIQISYMSTENVLRKSENRMTHWVCNRYLVLVDPEQVQIGEPEKIDEIGWFEIDSFPEPLHSVFANEVKQIKHHLARYALTEN